MLYDSTFNKFINIVLVLQVQKKKKKCFNKQLYALQAQKFKFT